MEKVGNAYVYYQSIDESKVAVVQALCNVMMAFPTLRLGQVINSVRETCSDISQYSDEFYIPDDELCAALERYLELHLKAKAKNYDYHK